MQLAGANKVVSCKCWQDYMLSGHSCFWLYDHQDLVDAQVSWSFEIFIVTILYRPVVQAWNVLWGLLLLYSPLLGTHCLDRGDAALCNLQYGDAALCSLPADLLQCILAHSCSLGHSYGTLL